MPIFKRKPKKPTVTRVETVLAIRCPLESYSLNVLLEAAKSLGEYEVISIAKVEVLEKSHG